MSDRTAAEYKHERDETIRLLRRVCAEHGDNDWPDDLHLADVIEKHLMRYFEARAGEGQGEGS